MMKSTSCVVALLGLGLLFLAQSSAQDGAKYDPTAVALAEIATLKVGKTDWPQWAGWSGRNNTPPGKNIPTQWDIDSGKNIKWQAKLGSQSPSSR